VSRSRNISVRTASSAVCPSRQRTGLVSKRKCDVVVNDPGVSGLHTFRPLRFVRKGIASKLSPSYLCASQSRLFVRVAAGHKPGAMPSGGCTPGAAIPSDNSGASANICGLFASGESQKGGFGISGAAYQEDFSCRKSWLFPQPRTNGGGRFL